MKKLIIMLALVAGVTTFSKAQGGQMGTPEERAKASVERPNVAALNLTADQKTKVITILTKQNKSQDSLMATIPGDDFRAKGQAAAPKMAPITAANEAAIVALLTADQKKAYDAALATAKQNNPNATGVFTARGRRPQ